MTKFLTLMVLIGVGSVGIAQAPDEQILQDPSGRLYQIRSGIQPLSPGLIPIQFVDDHAQIEFKTKDGRGAKVEAVGFNAIADANVMTITAVGAARISYSPLPAVPGVIGANRPASSQTVGSFELKLPKTGTGEFKAQIR